MSFDGIALDHCYAKPRHPLDEPFRAPVRYITLGKSDWKIDAEVTDDDEVVDVENPGGKYPFTLKYPLQTINTVDPWEETVEKSTWSSEKLSFFDDVLTILKAYHLATGVMTDRSTSSLKRHVALSKASMRLLRLLNSTAYNKKLFLWLHELLRNSGDYTTSWMEVISYFNAKYRGLFEKMQVIATMGPLLPKATLDKPKFPQLPFMSNVTIVIIPPRPHWYIDSRIKSFIWYLTKYFRVRSVKPTSRSSHGSAGLSLRRWLRNIVVETNNSLKKPEQSAEESSMPKSEKNHFVLLGWGISSMVALQISSEMKSASEDISAVIAICPPVESFAHGIRGHSDDPLKASKINVPLQFITGEHAKVANVSNLESFRDLLNDSIRSRISVVLGADDNLSVCSKKQLAIGKSQADFDLTVVEEIYNFLSIFLTDIKLEHVAKHEVREPPTHHNHHHHHHKSHDLYSAGVKRPLQIPPNKSATTRVGKFSRQSLPVTSHTMVSKFSSIRGSALLDSLSASLGVPQTSVAEQSETTCHDYASSSMPIAVPVNSAAHISSEQSLRYMLSAGVSNPNDTGIKRTQTAVTTSSLVQRGPNSYVFCKKIATPSFSVANSSRSSMH